MLDIPVKLTSSPFFRRFPLVTLACAVAMTGSIINVSPAVAQEESASLEEVMVTAQRREQSLMEVPISITAFTSTTIETNMIKGIEGYFDMTPNVTISDGATRSGNVSGSSLGLGIRGISNVGGNTSSFGFYMDDFNVTRATLNPQLVDVSRIEVLRGPQGTYFGRNASAGVISVTTNKPNEHLEGDIAVELREVGRLGLFGWESSGTINIPVSDSFMLRASAKYADSDGYARNETLTGETNGYKHKWARVAARILPSENWTIDLSATFNDEVQDDLGLIATGVGRSGIAPLLCSVLLQAGDVPSCPFDIADGLYPKNRTHYYHNKPLRVKDKYQLYNANVTWAGDNLTFTSVTGYIDTTFHRDGDLDFSSLDVLNEDFEDRDKSSISQEFRLASNNDGPFNWIIGGIWAKDKYDGRESINFGTDETINDFFGTWPGFRIEMQTTDQVITSKAMFAEGTWEATKRLTLTLGARWSEDEIDLAMTKIDFESVLPDMAAKKSWSDISPRVTATYSLSDDTNVYATIAKGWKSGGINLNFSADNPADAINYFDDETLWNYEIGIKSEMMDGRLRWGLSVFNIDWQDIQVNASKLIVSDDGGLVAISGVSNASQATSRGAEFELTALPLPQLQVGFNLGYLDAKFDDYQNADTFFGEFDLSGKQLPKAPEWTASANAQYNIHFNSQWEGFVRTEFGYQSDSFIDVNSIAGSLEGDGFPFVVPDRAVWNFRAGVQNGRYKIMAFVENAFDSVYHTSNFDFAFLNGAGVVPSFRSYGLRFTAKFGQN